MSKLTEKLNAIGMHNSYEFFVDEPYIYISLRGGSRDVIPSSYKVSKCGVSLSEAWYDYGAKSFSFCNRESKKEALEEAKKWAREKFGITEWARNPFGDYGDANFIQRRIEELTKPKLTKQ